MREQAHSCCILIARKELKINGNWYTHIDYDKFFELLQEKKEFGFKDYMKQTPKGLSLELKNKDLIQKKQSLLKIEIKIKQKNRKKEKMIFCNKRSIKQRKKLKKIKNNKT